MCTRPRPASAPPVPLAATLLVLLAACSSTSEDPTRADREALWNTTTTGGREAAPEDSQSAPGEEPLLATSTDDDLLRQPVGELLAGLEVGLNAWNQKKLVALSPKELADRQALEEVLRYRVQVRQLDIVHQLQTGPTVNRRRAAAALGFADNVEALPALEEALADRDAEVVSNALVGIGQLARRETNLRPITNLLEISSDGWTRNNAAFALKRLVEAGAREGDERLVVATSKGLTDTEPGVRVQCALVLSILLETDAIPNIAGLLHDDVALVNAAAARALSYMGTRDIHVKGECARHLADAARSTNDSQFRDHLMYEMSTMSQYHYGDDLDRWREWAYNMD